MKNKNLLLVISKFPPEYSGPGVRIPKLYDWFQEQNHEINLKIICNGIEEIKNETYLFQEYPVRRVTGEYLNKLFLILKIIPKRITHFLIYQHEFLKMLCVLFLSENYKNIDLLHVAGHSGGTAAALFWANVKNVPTLLELVNSEAKPYQKYLHFFKVTVPQKGSVAFLTQNCANKYRNWKDQAWVKPNPVDVLKFKPCFDEKYSLREKLTPFSKEDIIILSVAKFMPRKNQVFLIQVLNVLPDNFKLTLAGPKIEQGVLYDRDMNYFNNMISLIKENNLTSRVHIVSDYVESDQYMKASDVYVMPAWGEGLGTPMLEAMACGVPVVANEDEGAFQEWVIDEENGFLADIDAPESWAWGIEKSSIFDEEKCLKISSDISKKVKQENIYSEYENIFNTLLEG